ncbi:MAG: YcaO-like family protein [Methanomicrobiaceae archaeon]|nr:YcaO-like family protein [Methanomicrobiaceae archaeon]
MNTPTIREVSKQFFNGTHRALTPEETCRIIRPLIPDIGVSEILDLTPFDRLGIPVAATIRPRAARSAENLRAGAGADPILAKIAALMAAIERYSVEYRGQQMQFASHEELGLTRSVDPRDLILPRPFGMGEQVHWTPSWDLLNEEEIAVPSNAVYHPYDPMGMGEILFQSDDVGLAGGMEPEEAILHGMLEVVERDALSTAERARNLGSRITVDRDGPARRLLDLFTGAGIEMHLWLLPGRTGIPAVAVSADDTVSKDPALLVTGSAAHTDPEIAVIRALMEVARSRAVYLHRGRIDAVREAFARKAGYERLKRINRLWYSSADETELSAISSLSTERFDQDIARCLDEIGAHADRVCVTDLTSTPVPVVRVIIPGFEVSYSDTSRIRGQYI